MPLIDSGLNSKDCFGVKIVWISSVLNIPSSCLCIALNSLGTDKKYLSLTNKLSAIKCLPDSCSGKSNGFLLEGNLSNGKQLPRPWGNCFGVAELAFGRGLGNPGISAARCSLSDQGHGWV